MALDFEILSLAGVSAGDLAKIIEIPAPNNTVKTVSRTAVFNWTRQLGSPMDYAYPHIAKVLDAIRGATEAKELPLPLNTKRKDRIETLKAVINSRM